MTFSKSEDELGNTSVCIPNANIPFINGRHPVMCLVVIDWEIGVIDIKWTPNVS